VVVGGRGGVGETGGVGGGGGLGEGMLKIPGSKTSYRIVNHGEGGSVTKGKTVTVLSLSPPPSVLAGGLFSARLCANLPTNLRTNLFFCMSLVSMVSFYTTLCLSSLLCANLPTNLLANLLTNFALLLSCFSTHFPLCKEEKSKVREQVRARRCSSAHFPLCISHTHTHTHTTHTFSHTRSLPLSPPLSLSLSLSNTHTHTHTHRCTQRGSCRPVTLRQKFSKSQYIP